MGFITILQENVKKKNQENWYLFLTVQKFLVEEHFNWLRLEICLKRKLLIGEGILKIGSKSYSVLLSFSPFFNQRYDRIYINDKSIKYNREIHLYPDHSLCLYHPIFDQPAFKNIQLFEMIPWISEWIIFYEQWKKYGVWFGKEIKH